MMEYDLHRPRYHFSPDNWMNDPIPFFWNGAYHIFFQYNPDGAYHANMHWGHAVSRDLVHWTELPIALAPTPGSPDQDGCWTGCVVASEGRFYAFYTGIPASKPLRQVQCLATSTDLTQWEKYAGNPVIAEPPAGFGECFRDPCVWKEGDEWLMVIGSQRPEGAGGAALLYGSPDLIHWRYLHPLCLGDARRTGFDFECPDFFPLGEKWTLLTSRVATHWQVGASADQTFLPESIGDADGDVFYAAKTLQDAQGRRLLFGWIQERRPSEASQQAGWSGVLSLPRVLTLLPDGTLGMEPAPELTALRGRHQHWEDLRLSEDGLLLPDVQGDALEILVRFAPTEAAGFGVQVRCSPGRDECVEVAYDRQEQRLGDVPLLLAEGEGLTLHVYVDHSVIEAFANGRACRTLRAYPERADALGVGLFVRGGALKVNSVDVWEMRV